MSPTIRNLQFKDFHLSISGPTSRFKLAFSRLKVCFQLRLINHRENLSAVADVEQKNENTESTQPAAPAENPNTEASINEAEAEIDIDQVISEADPNFAQSMKEIGLDKSLTLPTIIMSSEEQELNEEKDRWKNGGKITVLLLKVMPFLPWVNIKANKFAFALSSLMQSISVHLKNFFYFLRTDCKDKFIYGIKTAVHVVSGFIAKWFGKFKALSKPLKVLFFVTVVLIVGTGFFIYRSWTRGIIPSKTELFMTTLEKVSSETVVYDEEELEPFYENLRVSDNIIMLPKMVVNLRKSPKSGPNPMGAFEFYIEGMIPEVAIEIKDREVEVRDLMQRELEEFNFDQVESAEGKQVVCEKLKKVLNNFLTTGAVKKIFIKTVIVKP